MVRREGPAREAPSGSTSASMRTMLREARMLLTNDDAALDDQIASMADQPELLEEEREQLAELSRLMQSCGDDSGALTSLRRDGEFVITPSQDQMLLTMTVHPPMAGGQPVAVEQVIAWLRERDIKQGVDVNAIRQSLQKAQQDSVEDVVIVRGRLARCGSDGRVEVFGRRTPDAPLEMVWSSTESTRVPGMWLCLADDQIARIVPPDPGVPGHDALGNEIAPPTPSPGTLDIGANIRAAGSAFYAQVSGVVAFNCGQLEVRKVMVIARQLNRCDEAVEFDGDVHVRAGVGSGAVIRATGDITVEGAVEAATLESRQGSIRLKHGVAGQNRATIRAHEDVITRFAENSFILAGRDVVIEIGSLHSRIVAGRNIHATRGRGQIIGGSVMVGNVLEVKQLGAKSNVATEVVIGVSRDILDKLGDIEQRVATYTERASTCGELADRMQRAVGDPARLQHQELQTYAQLRKVQLVCRHQLRLLSIDRETLFAESAKDFDGRIDVIDDLFCGTTIRLGELSMPITKPHTRCRVSYDKSQCKLVVGRL